MHLLDTEIPPLGMGCWPIGGPMFSGDISVGYSRSDDARSIQTIHAALDAGIRLFDTAAAYGAGHAERLLGQTLKRRDDVLIITKIGYHIDEMTRQITDTDPDPKTVNKDIEGCLARLDRDCIDILLLHPNQMPLKQAMPLFDEMEKARASGKIRAYGWSTDFVDNIKALDGRDGVVGIEHAMNVFFDAPGVRNLLAEWDLASFIRSPLAMGLLGGKYTATSQLPADDVRASGQSWITYFSDGRPDPAYLKTLNAVRDLLQSGGRSLVQGALCWLWAKSDRAIPLPGARTPSQITELAGALKHGPLPDLVMAEIETLIDREPEGKDRAR